MLSYEVQTHYIINVTARDLGTPSLSNSTVIAVEIVDLNLNPPVFVDIPPPLSIREDVPVNYTVVTVTATDRDSGSNAQISFDLANDQGYFTITSNGAIVVSAPLDAAIVPSYNLTVIATDCGSPQRLTSTISLPVTVQDVGSLPSFTQAVYLVSVTYPNGVNVTMTGGHHHGDHAYIMSAVFMCINHNTHTTHMHTTHTSHTHIYTHHTHTHTPHTYTHTYTYTHTQWQTREQMQTSLLP